MRGTGLSCCDKQHPALRREITIIRRRKPKDLRGVRNGRLIGVCPTDRDRGAHKNIVWETVCDCGNTVYVSTGDFHLKGTTSCGCAHRDELVARNTIHGDAPRTGYKGMYHTWAAMKQRCTNPKREFYYLYGGKGIKVCPEWTNYLPFKQWAEAHGWAPGLCIDRIDPEGDYCPDNCQWLTPGENSAKANRQRRRE